MYQRKHEQRTFEQTFATIATKTRFTMGDK